MEYIMTFAVICLVVLVLSIIAYTYTTNRIIKDQDKEIMKLNTDNYRLRTELHKANKSKKTQVIEIHDSRIAEENIPTFGD